jgi:hypothetical protein
MPEAAPVTIAIPAGRSEFFKLLSPIIRGLRFANQKPGVTPSGAMARGLMADASIRLWLMMKTRSILCW